MYWQEQQIQEAEDRALDGQIADFLDTERTAKTMTEPIDPALQPYGTASLDAAVDITPPGHMNLRDHDQLCDHLYLIEPDQPVVTLTEWDRQWGHPLVNDMEDGCPGGAAVVIDCEAAARSRWDVRFGEGSWDHPDNADDAEASYTRRAFLASAERDVAIALGLTDRNAITGV